MTDAKPPEKAPTTETPPKPAAQESPAASPPGAPRSDPAKVAQSLGAALKAFWTSFPGILTAVGGLIAAAATLITALDKAV